MFLNDRVSTEEMYAAARKVINMKLSEFRMFEPTTAGEAMVYSLGRRSLQGDVKAFEQLNKLASLAMSKEELKSLIHDPLSAALAELAKSL